MVRNAGANLTPENDVFVRRRAHELGLSRSAVVNEAVARYRGAVSTTTTDESGTDESETPEILAMIGSIERNTTAHHAEKIRRMDEVEAELVRMVTAVDGEVQTAINAALDSRDAMIDRFLKSIEAAVSPIEIPDKTPA
ncbi:MAG: hypothetical protein ABSA63_06070 [Thermoplasmata archaeon]|jgi:hypothetical protein